MIILQLALGAMALFIIGIGAWAIYKSLSVNVHRKNHQKNIAPQL